MTWYLFQLKFLRKIQAHLNLSYKTTMNLSSHSSFLKHEYFHYHLYSKKYKQLSTEDLFKPPFLIILPKCSNQRDDCFNPCKDLFSLHTWLPLAVIPSGIWISTFPVKSHLKKQFLRPFDEQMQIFRHHRPYIFVSTLLCILRDFRIHHF